MGSKENVKKGIEDQGKVTEMKGNVVLVLVGDVKGLRKEWGRKRR